jgi:hypothetical protein
MRLTEDFVRTKEDDVDGGRMNRCNTCALKTVQLQTLRIPRHNKSVRHSVAFLIRASNVLFVVTVAGVYSQAHLVEY